jgi:hypothetical protein
MLYVYIDRQSYLEIRSFKEIQMTKITLPQPHSATQHSSNFMSRHCKAVFVANSSRRMRLRNSGIWRVRVWRWLQYDAAHPQKAPFSAIYLPVHTAIEPCHLQQRKYSPLVAPQAIVSMAPLNLFKGDRVEWYVAISSWCLVGWAWGVDSDCSVVIWGH